MRSATGAGHSGRWRRRWLLSRESGVVNRESISIPIVDSPYQDSCPIPHSPFPRMPIIPENRLKRTLSAGRVAIGTMLVEFRQASVMRLLANAGLDWVIVDTEHG